MIFDATKITYNKYSCAISGMSREMTSEIVPNVKTRKRRDVDVILKFN